MNNKKRAKFLFISVILLMSTNVNSALIERLDGQAFYDTVLDITWLADANYAKTSGYDADGLMNWQDSMAWAEQLVFADHSNWRLASYRDPASAINAPCNGYNCTDSELAFMYYENLNGDGTSRTTRTGIPDPFINIYAQYWSGMVVESDFSINYHFNDGLQFYHPNSQEFAAWAVMDGDISAVPIPAAVWLLGSGLVALLGFSKRRKAS